MNMLQLHFDPLVRKAAVEAENQNIEEYILRNKYFSYEELQYIATQAYCRQKARSKLPDWYSKPDIFYPSKLSIEQCSSQTTASYKSLLFAGNHLLDLTGGLGVDSYYFSFRFKNTTYVEKDEQLFLAAQHNFNLLGNSSIRCIHQTAEDFLQSRPSNRYDLIYLDPARRNQGNKVITLRDSSPDVISALPALFILSDKILIKASPLIDIKQSIKLLPELSEVFVISVKNECKEVLFLLTKHPQEEISIRTVLINKSKAEEFVFLYSEEAKTYVNYGLPMKYLYEPDVALLKAGMFKSIAARYNLYKLHKNTHLYTSEALVHRFPGRIFKLNSILEYSKKTLQSVIKDKKANITARNFPDSVPQIRKKLSLTEGGDVYLFAITDMLGRHVILHTEKVT